jgi:hypothetical protein
MAVARIGRGGSGRARRTISGGFIANHPRIFLTSAKKTELIARKDANTTDYAAMKSYVDSGWTGKSTDNSTLTSTLTTGGVGTTFTVADGSSFPTASTSYLVDLELITATRSGNTMTIVTRGASIDGSATTNVAHASGATIWEYTASLDKVGLTPATALLVQLGVAGYDVKARLALNHLLAAATPIYTSWDYIRWYWPQIAQGYDWNYDNLTANEKSVFAAQIQTTANWHSTGTGRKEWYSKEEIGRQRHIETGMSANIANGQVRAVLFLSAATYGDNPDAQTTWNIQIDNVEDYLTPAMIDGPFSGGNNPEGTEYVSETWSQTHDIFSVLNSATGSTAYWSTYDTWVPNFVKFAIYQAVPGSSRAAATTGSISSGTTSLVVASATGWSVGQPIQVVLDTSAQFETAVVAISGTTFTLRDPVPSASTGQAVRHISRMVAYGDVQNSNLSELGNLNFGDVPYQEYQQEAVEHAIDRLRTTDTTTAGYAKYFLENVAPAHANTAWTVQRFIWNDPDVVEVDYTAALPTMYASANPFSTGLVIGKSSWAANATQALFLVGGETQWDHIHSHMNSYQLRRKGVILTGEVAGYDILNYPGTRPNYPTTNGFGECAWLGGEYHNTILMNGHSSNNGRLVDAALDAGLLPSYSTIERCSVNTNYFYARGDASLAYRSSSWAGLGYANNNAQTFIRDAIYDKENDVFVFYDRLAYSGATVSPTTWIAIFAGNPTIASQKITSTHGGQTIIHDILAPTGATLTETSLASEDSDLQGYRVSTVSGANTAAEESFQVIQLGDSGFSDASPTALTTTNAYVTQVGTKVYGFMRGASPTINVSYAYTGTPTHRIAGLAASTAYHFTAVAGTATLVAATGSGDTTTNAAGVLEF